jgi:preprotein translocase subunit SecA
MIRPGSLKNRWRPGFRVTSHRHDLKTVDEIRTSTDRVSQLTQPQLQRRAEDLREQLAQGESPLSDDFLICAFALVSEAARRTIGIVYYDVQLLAGLALARGCVAEMQTGEGKTLVAALPAFTHALTGRGVHVVTANSYLAGRDHQLLSPVYESMGLSSALLPERTGTAQKQAAYACDIVYGTGYEFGFDYLRDQVFLRQRHSSRLGDSILGLLRGQAPRESQLAQRGLAFAIIDEIDNILIDDASSPLVLSNQATVEALDGKAHLAARSVIDRLRTDHYELDAVSGVARLTNSGSQFVYEKTNDIPLKSLLRPWSQYVEQAIRARELYRRDVHYVVRDGKVCIVDESTGRIFSERSWRDGLHQAIEAKEGVSITSEQQPVARITRQRYFRLYDGLCGMTGTATGSEREFREFYSLPVLPIPLRMPSKRVVFAPRFFADQHSKWSAIGDEVLNVHRTGRPVLVGTRTIADSETLARQLETRQLPFQLLNGCQDENEAAIVGRSGQRGAITIATNMAGRGTDIKLTTDALERDGLHVIAAEPHASHRIDRQLFGRCARQGEPGSAQLFVSADDDLLKRDESRLRSKMRKVKSTNNEIRIDLMRSVKSLQDKSERIAFRKRRRLFRSDDYRDSLLVKLTGTD